MDLFILEIVRQVSHVEVLRLKSKFKRLKSIKDVSSSSSSFISIQFQKKKGKTWKENPLKYFTHPRKNLSRNDALKFCQNNNATLLYWSNANELDFIANQLATTVSQLFREEFIRFYIGFKQVNQIKQWQDQVCLLLSFVVKC